ncbi:MAG: SHOCT domain-containing protein [Burkholderiales bacterium]
MWWSDWWGGYGPGPAHWMLFGPLMMILFLVACVSVAYLVMRPYRADGAHAMEILKERYARGEIDQAEFEARRRLLQA